MRVSRRLGLGIVAALALESFVRGALADEPVAAREPNLMSEAAEITSVVDAFDKDDPFDLNILVGINQSFKHAKIRRESQLAQPGLEGAPGQQAGFIPASENIASYQSSMTTLNLGADVGIYHDLALILRLPIVLSWSQSLGDLDGSSAVASQVLADPSGGQLFSVPFTSPTRSGLDYFAFGLDWDIFNQARDDTKPTWLVGIEGRVAVGAPLHACSTTPVNGAPQCPDPTTWSSTTQSYPAGSPSRSPGLSKGYDSIIAKTVWSRRFGYIEPYSGFWAQADFPTSGSDFGKWNPQQNLDRSPPLQGSFAVGMEVVPWEHREQFQKLSADFRFKGTYHSPGRDYSELFDALGSSQAASLRNPNPAAYTSGPNGTSVADLGSEQVYFTGITEVAAYGSFTLSAAGTWQAGQYIKFTLGAGFTYAQSHLVTAADVCTPNGNTNQAAAGPCIDASSGQVQGVPNPDHRDIIDLPGHRFSVDDTTIVDLYAMGIVMF